MSSSNKAAPNKNDVPEIADGRYTLVVGVDGAPFPNLKLSLMGIRTA